MSVIAICSGKGSPGATFLAANLSAAMARAGEDVLVLDLDPSGGDLCCYLGLDPRRGLYPMLRLEGGVPGPDGLLAEAEERAGFLALCGFPEPDNLASPEVLSGILRAARATDRRVLADLGRASGDVGEAVPDADRVILVVRPDLVSVLGAERALRWLDAADVPRERIDLVVSGIERRRPADVNEVEEALGLPVLGSVPLDRRGARKALVQQTPATTRPLRKAFDALAERVLAAGRAETQESTTAPARVAS
jgi:Flp pilus assembly CpaE family ATPase